MDDLEELLKYMEHYREGVYKRYNEAQLEADEHSLAYIEGLIAGADVMIALVKERMEGNNDDR